MLRRMPSGVSIGSPDYWNPRYYVLPLVDHDDLMTAILIVVLRQVVGNDLSVGHGIGRLGEWHALVVFDRQSLSDNVKVVP